MNRSLALVTHGGNIQLQVGTSQPYARFVGREGIIAYEHRATSHTRLRARDHYTSSILIGGKGGAGPSSLHTTLEGPTEYVIARWM